MQSSRMLDGGKGWKLILQICFLLVFSEHRSLVQLRHHDNSCLLTTRCINLFATADAGITYDGPSEADSKYSSLREERELDELATSSQPTSLPTGVYVKPSLPEEEIDPIVPVAPLEPLQPLQPPPLPPVDASTTSDGTGSAADGNPTHPSVPPTPMAGITNNDGGGGKSGDSDTDPETTTVIGGPTEIQEDINKELSEEKRTAITSSTYIFYTLVLLVGVAVGAYLYKKHCGGGTSSSAASSSSNTGSGSSSVVASIVAGSSSISSSITGIGGINSSAAGYERVHTQDPDEFFSQRNIEMASTPS